MGTKVKKDRLAYLHNKSIKSAVFTFYKKAVAKIAENSASETDVFSAVRKYESLAMRAARKGVISRQSASRKVSGLTVKAKVRFNQTVTA